MSPSPKIRTLDMAYIAMFAVMIAVCSWISIPSAVPFTMQTFGIFLTLGILGGRRGTLAIFTYLLLGALGLPVFSNFSGGIGVLFGNTGGYILGFFLSALLFWGMEHFFGKNKSILILSLLLGLFVCYLFGTAWFMFLYGRNTGEIGILTALGWCVFPYILPDIAKLLLALSVRKKLLQFI